MSNHKLILFVLLEFCISLISSCVNAFSSNGSGNESIGIINVDTQTLQQHWLPVPNSNNSSVLQYISSPVLRKSQISVPITGPPILPLTITPSRVNGGVATFHSAQPTTEQPQQQSDASISSSSSLSPFESTTSSDAHDIEVEPIISPQHQLQPAWQLSKSELNIWEGEPTHTLVALLRLRHPLKRCALDARGTQLFTLEKRSPTLVRLLSRLSFDRESTSIVEFTVHCELRVPASTADGHEHEDALVRVSRELVRQWSWSYLYILYTRILNFLY